MRLTRRSFLEITGMAIATGTVFESRNSEAQQTYSDRSVTDRWIDAWMKAPRSANDPLHLGRFADPMYYLLLPIGWKPNPGQEALPPVEVPENFVTDFASIPQVFWSALPKDGLYTYPAIVHDYLYWEQRVSRDKADLIFRNAMEDFKVSGPTRTLVYAGVRAGGGAAWDENRKRRDGGERRILKKRPPTSTVTWEEWRKTPGTT